MTNLNKEKMMAELIECTFIFSATCGTDDFCPRQISTAKLAAFKQRIDGINNPLESALKRDRLVAIEERLLGLGYYPNTGSPGVYRRDIFVGLAKARAFTRTDAGEIIPPTENPSSPGYEVLQLLFQKIFADIQAEDRFDWFIWTVVPIPDSTLDDTAFKFMGGSGRG